jgi:hypothetical protein
MVTETRAKYDFPPITVSASTGHFQNLRERNAAKNPTFTKFLNDALYLQILE